MGISADGRRRKAAPKLRPIVASIRNEIVAGTYPPKMQLPARSHWESHFEVSWATIQRAFDVLAREEFIRADRRIGTFVADDPPHLCRIGVVFRHRPAERAQWARFCDNLLAEIPRLENRRRRIVAYEGINGHVDVEDYRRLVADIENGRLAGLVFTFPPGDELSGSPLLADPRIARVQIEGQPAQDVIPRLKIDWNDFFERAMAGFAARGRRRVALVSYRGFYEDHSRQFHAARKRHGLTTREHWIQEPDWSYPFGIRQCVNLLVRGSEAPDALIIGDDNLVEAAAEGVRDAGVSTPEDLDLVAFGNLPYLTPTCVPMQHIGFRAATLLNRCLESLERQVQGSDVPGDMIITLESCWADASLAPRR